MGSGTFGAGFVSRLPQPYIPLEISVDMIAFGVTQGEKLCNFLLDRVLHKLPWPVLEEALAPTGRPEMAELFREITAVNLTGRIVAGGVSVASLAGIDSPIYGDQFSHLLRFTAPVLFDLEDELFRFADRAVRAARQTSSPRELRRLRQWAEQSHPYCFMCGVRLNFEDEPEPVGDLNAEARAERDRRIACMYTCEHIWPRSYGGDSDEENYLPACHSCNNWKKSDFATWAMTSAHALIHGVEPDEVERRRKLSTVAGTYRFALHYRKAQQIARDRRWTLRRSFLFLGPWERDIRVCDTGLVADFFNMEIHRDNLPLILR